MLRTNHTEFPSATPWGAPQRSDEIIEGVFSCDTASHGGYYVTEAVNATIPSYLRNEDGWYEEDCEWAKAHLALGIDKHSEHAKSALKRWFPELYERHFGVTVTAEECPIVREREFRAANASRLIVVSAWGDWHDSVPKGMVGCFAVRGGRTGSGEYASEDRGYFLVPEDAYAERAPDGFLIDEARHERIGKL